MERTRSVWLQELTWQEVETYLTREQIALFPVGSTEQHGPAGPLGVDSYAAIALAEDAAKQTGVLVTPPLWFGDSPHHLDFAGTISLRTGTLTAVAKDVLRSLHRHGFRKVVVINGHKGTNLAGLTTACRTLHQEELPDLLVALVDPMFLGRGAARFKEAREHHAGELEISHVWYRFPDLIREERLTHTAVDLEPVLSPYCTPDLFGGGGDHVEVFWNSAEQRAFAPDGSFSDSSRASREKGRQYHEYLVANLVGFIEWMRAYAGPVGATGAPGSHMAAGL